MLSTLEGNISTKTPSACVYGILEEASNPVTSFTPLPSSSSTSFLRILWTSCSPSPEISHCKYRTPKVRRFVKIYHCLFSSLVRTQKRIQNGLEVLQYYTTRRWYFHNEKLDKTLGELSEEEKRIFYTDREHINWNEYILTYILGCRKYCIHEEPDTIPYARKMLKR